MFGFAEHKELVFDVKASLASQKNTKQHTLNDRTHRFWTGLEFHLKVTLKKKKNMKNNFVF